MIRCAVNLFGRLAMARVVGQVFACTPMCSGGAAKRKPFAIQVRNPKDGAKADRSIAQLKRIAKAAGVPAEEFSELKSWPAPQSYPYGVVAINVGGGTKLAATEVPSYPAPPPPRPRPRSMPLPWTAPVLRKHCRVANVSTARPMAQLHLA